VIPDESKRIITNGTKNKKDYIDTEYLAALLKSNTTLWDSLQLLLYFSVFDEAFLTEFFLMPGLNKMKNLREFICCWVDSEAFEVLMSLFK
jgi:hypothetical protein